MPAVALEMLRLLSSQLEPTQAKLKALEARLMAWHKADPVSRCHVFQVGLATQPGIGPPWLQLGGAVSFSLKVADPKGFRSGRHFAAWLGLPPKENSTGGHRRLGRISRQRLPRRRPGAMKPCASCWCSAPLR